jgi:hypothetical protein
MNKMEPYIFYTHYNYERIFRVEVDGPRICIFKHMWEILDKDKNDYIIELKSFENMYLGTQPGDIYDSFYHGNTLLIKVKDNKYIFVGEIVYGFELDEDILYYSSRVIKGQPFPYFLTKNHYYLLLDNVRIPINFEGDPYECSLEWIKWINIQLDI